MAHVSPVLNSAHLKLVGVVGKMSVDTHCFARTLPSTPLYRFLDMPLSRDVGDVATTKLLLETR